MQDLFLRYQGVIRPLLRASPLVGGVAILFWRVRETRVPLSRRAIVIPPLAMSSGLFMFLSPIMQVPWTWAIGALLAGFFVLSYPLVRSSRLESRDGVIYLQRSRAFLVILLGLLAVRLLLHDYIGHLVSPLQTAALFYLLALGMIVRWRWGLYRGYQRITNPAL